MRVFVADDHAFVRVGIRQVLEELGGFTVIGEAADGRQVLNSPVLGQADVLVLDLSLPIVSGPEVLRRVRAQWPSVAVVVLSMHPEDQFARRALKDGAAAYLSKERPPTDLVAAVRRAGEGHRDAVPGDAAVDEAPHTRLTRREHQIFLQIVGGKTVSELAAELDVHACTVSNHLASVRSKLGLQTVAELVRYAVAQGLVGAPPEEPAR
ncbi:MAG: response regulator transcription factor [Myxococcales bacterium]|nr:response regulator transcription factor [Myxococcales bacterium]